MTDYRTIFTMILMGYTQRDITAACKVSPKTVVAARKAVEQGKLTAADIACLTDQEVRDIVSPPRARARDTRAEPDLAWAEQELSKGQNIKQVWQMYSAACLRDGVKAYGYTAFAALLRKSYTASRATAAPRLRPGMLLICTALPCDPCMAEGTKYRCIVFMLPYSQELLILPTEDLKRAWPMLMVRCLNELGGVPSFLYVPEDFMGVYRMSKGVRQVRPDSEAVLRYYGITLTEVLPEPLGTELQDALRHLRKALDGRSFSGIGEIKAVLGEIRGDYTSEVLPSGRSRNELYEVFERPSLRALPEVPWEATLRKDAKIGYNYHIRFEKVYYSVPPEAYKEGKDVVLLVTRRKIEIVSQQGEVLAVHSRRSSLTTSYSTLPEHVRTEAYLEEHNFPWTAARFISWAGREFSPSAVAVVKRILSSREITTQAYRTAMIFLQQGAAEEAAGRLDRFLLACDNCINACDPIKAIKRQLSLKDDADDDNEG